MVNACRFKVKTKYKIVYPNLKSVRRPTLHKDDNIPVPVLPKNDLQMSDEVLFCDEVSSDIETNEMDAVLVS